MKLSVYFDSNEFDSPDEPDSGLYMDEKFIKMLTNAREIAQIPFRINSGFRTEKHNRQVKGRFNSAHLKGLAADIFCPFSHNRFVIVNALMLSEFNRIGIYSNFIHADFDSSKDGSVIWLG